MVIDPESQEKDKSTMDLYIEMLEKLSSHRAFERIEDTYNTIERRCSPKKKIDKID